MNNSNWTGRTNRTMQEAFGPYTSRSIHEQYTPMDWQDKAVVIASVLALVALGVILVI